MRGERPAGVAVLSVLHLLGALVLVAVFIPASVALVFRWFSLASIVSVLIWGGAVVLAATAGVGLWRLWPLGWHAAVVAEMVWLSTNLVGGLLGIITGSVSEGLALLVRTPIPVLVTGYLVTAGVRSAFGISKETAIGGLVVWFVLSLVLFGGTVFLGVLAT